MSANLFLSNRPPYPSKIPPIRRRIDELDQQIAELQRRRRLLHSTVSVVRRLPPEILGLIFQSLFTQTVDDFSCVRWLINVCLVCTTWRRAALDSQALWTDLKVRTDEGHPFTQRDYEGVERWFGRAGARSKRLAIQFYCSTRRCHGCLTNPYLVKLLTHGPEMKVVDSTDSRPRPWDLLKSLGLDIGEIWAEGYTFNANKSLFCGLPQISHLRLDTSLCTLGHAIRIPPPLLSMLSSLSLRCDEKGVAVEVLRCCSNIEKLQLDLSHDAEVSWSAIETNAGIRMPKLRKLRMTGLSTSRQSVLLRFVEATVLEELDMGFCQSRVHVCYGHSNFSIGEWFKAFLKSSGSAQTLRQVAIRIRGMRMDIEDLDSVFNGVKLTAVAHIILEDVVDSSELFTLLEFYKTPGKRTFAPSLETLQIIRTQPYPEFKDEDVVDWVTNRHALMAEDGTPATFGNLKVTLWQKEIPEKRTCYAPREPSVGSLSDEDFDFAW